MICFVLHRRPRRCFQYKEEIDEQRCDRRRGGGQGRRHAEEGEAGREDSGRGGGQWHPIISLQPHRHPLSPPPPLRPEFQSSKRKIIRPQKSSSLESRHLLVDHRFFTPNTRNGNLLFFNKKKRKKKNDDNRALYLIHIGFYYNNNYYYTYGQRQMQRSGFHR